MNKTLPAWLLCILINVMPVMASDDDSYLFSKGIDIQLNKHVIDNNDNKIKWTAFLRDGTPLEAINGDEHGQRFHIPPQYIRPAYSSYNPAGEHYMDIIIQVSRPWRFFNNQWMAGRNIGQNRMRFGARVRFNHEQAWVETKPNSGIPIIPSVNYQSCQDVNQPDNISLNMRSYELTQQIWGIWFSTQQGPSFPYDACEEVDGISIASNPNTDAAMEMGMGHMLIEYSTAAEVMQNVNYDYASSPMAFGG